MYKGLTINSKPSRLKAGYGLVLMMMMTITSEERSLMMMIMMIMMTMMLTSEERSLMKCSSSKSESSSRPLMVAGPPAGGNFLFLMIILYLRAREEGDLSIFDYYPTCNYPPFRNVVTCSVPKSSKPFNEFQTTVGGLRVTYMSCEGDGSAVSPSS